MGVTEIVNFALLTEAQESSYIPPAPVIQIPIGDGSKVVEHVEKAHRLGLKVYVWTVNRRDEMEILLDAGADGIITDDPILLKEVLADRD